MKILFLDMDGVICTDRSGARMPNPDCLKELKRILDLTACDVVLTTSWRKSKRLLDRITSFGVPYIGLTDDLSMPEDAHGAVHRELEIKIWVKEHAPERFAILDDDRHAWEGKELFRTSYPKGLTVEIADKVIKYLNA